MLYYNLGITLGFIIKVPPNPSITSTPNPMITIVKIPHFDIFRLFVAIPHHKNNLPNSVKFSAPIFRFCLCRIQKSDFRYWSVGWRGGSVETFASIHVSHFDSHLLSISRPRHRLWGHFRRLYRRPASVLDFFPPS